MEKRNALFYSANVKTLDVYHGHQKIDSLLWGRFIRSCGFSDGIKAGEQIHRRATSVLQYLRLTHNEIRDYEAFARSPPVLLH